MHTIEILMAWRWNVDLYMQNPNTPAKCLPKNPKTSLGKREWWGGRGAGKSKKFQ